MVSGRRNDVSGLICLKIAASRPPGVHAFTVTLALGVPCRVRTWSGRSPPPFERALGGSVGFAFLAGVEAMLTMQAIIALEHVRHHRLVSVEDPLMLISLTFWTSSTE